MGIDSMFKDLANKFLKYNNQIVITCLYAH